MKVGYLAAMLLAASSGSAAAQQVRFTGTTTADETIIRDALRIVVQYGRARHNCTTLSAVEAAVLPADYRPRDTRYRAADEPIRYERWDALMCGHTMSFLIGFWPSAVGGTMFQVSHPLPDDVPAIQSS